ncbi:hypothetical protein [Paenibacillus luteus]|uniref:hypothetical protein n=1 Tax=Paenibacillus luteus TaxID=2545753 RepID=UPI003BAD239B
MRKKQLIASIMLLFSIAITGCGAEKSANENGTGNGANAGTAVQGDGKSITHEWGTYKIEQAPQKVVTLDFSFMDTLTSLGVTPVGNAGVGTTKFPEYLQDQLQAKVADVTGNLFPYTAQKRKIRKKASAFGLSMPFRRTVGFVIPFIRANQRFAPGLALDKAERAKLRISQHDGASVNTELLRKLPFGRKRAARMVHAIDYFALLIVGNLLIQGSRALTIGFPHDVHLLL